MDDRITKLTVYHAGGKRWLLEDDILELFNQRPWRKWFWFFLTRLINWIGGGK